MNKNQQEFLVNALYSRGSSRNNDMTTGKNLTRQPERNNL